MKHPVVIADASPLIALARIGHLHLLRDVFGEVVLTEIVQQEVLAGGDFADAIPVEQAIQAGWLQPKPSPEAMNDLATIARTGVAGLDPGEKSSILLALAYQQSGHTTRLIIDEMKCRAVARHLSLELIGSAGIIAIAKRLELIPLARPLLERLQASGYYLSQAVVDNALRIAGECH